MEKHPITDLMETTMNKLRDMVDVNTIIGNPVSTVDGITLIPVSKVSFGFASGGTDFQPKNQKETSSNSFGGGAGAGVKIDPVAFLVIKDGSVRMISANPAPNGPVEKVIDLVPEVIDKIKEIFPKKKDEDTEE
jgi:sporulation protein YtfJ